MDHRVLGRARTMRMLIRAARGPCSLTMRVWPRRAREGIAKKARAAVLWDPVAMAMHRRGPDLNESCRYDMLKL